MAKRAKGNPQEGQNPADQRPQEAPCPQEAGNSGQTPIPDPPADVDLPQGLDARQVAAVEALLQQPTILRAAASVGIHERTLRRWIEIPEFCAALRKARRQSFAQAIGLTQSHASVAAATLVRVMNDTAVPAHCRVSAAAFVLRFGREGIELDDLADRVETLEKNGAPPLLPAPTSESVAEEMEDEE